MPLRQRLPCLFAYHSMEAFICQCFSCRRRASPIEQAITSSCAATVSQIRLNLSQLLSFVPKSNQIRDRTDDA